ncbi:MAG: M48 family metallopeptidase [Pseudomonadota bacterium]
MRHKTVETKWRPAPSTGLPTCRLRRSRRRTLAVHVRDCQVEIRAPQGMGESAIARFVGQQTDWILGRLEEQRKQQAEKLRVIDGGRIFYKARECKLRLRPSLVGSVQVEGRTITIHCRGATPEHGERVLRDWLMQQAREHLYARTEALASALGLEGRFREVVLRKTRSKWGHCTSEGRIQYNWLIMLAPDAVIDYLISHEVAHLRHLDHSRAFWALVGEVCPDYQRYRHWLRDHGHRLWF